MSQPAAADRIVIPALLRAARGAYGNAIRERLVASGFEDMPRNGSYIVGGMANHGVPARGLLRELGISQQAASELVDTLVVRGYLERRPDPNAPGRQTVALTDRGRGAAEAIRDGVESVDSELAEILTPAELAGLCAGLVALTDIRERSEQQAEASAAAQR